MEFVVEHAEVGQSPRFWGKRETAAFLRISTSTLDQWGRDGYGPERLKIGGLVRFDPAQVQKWAKAQVAVRVEAF